MIKNLKVAAKLIANLCGAGYSINSTPVLLTGKTLPAAEAPLTLRQANHDLSLQLRAGRRVFLGRWGTTEYTCVVSMLGFVPWYQPRYNRQIAATMNINSGLFPVTAKSIADFSEIYVNASRNVTHHALLGEDLCPGERQFLRHINASAEVYPKGIFSVWNIIDPWVNALAGKKVLFISPFVCDMKLQFPVCSEVWKNSELSFGFEPIWFEAVQSRGKTPTGFSTWFDSLSYMSNEVSKLDFDIALLSCGAYGLPLADFIFSTMKRSAIYFGGSLQLLFGLRGERWDRSNAVNEFLNDYWRYPMSNHGDISNLPVLDNYGLPRK